MRRTYTNFNKKVNITEFCLKAVPIESTNPVCPHFDRELYCKTVLTVRINKV